MHAAASSGERAVFVPITPCRLFDTRPGSDNVGPKNFPMLAGEQWIERRSFARALDKMLRREAGFREVSAVLTPREVEVVRLAAAGLRNGAIGERLRISEGTVKVHLHNIYEKLHVDSRVALTLYAREKGLA